MKGKNGVSSVVATVLLVLLTITTITVLASFIIPFVKERLSGTDCIKYRENFMLEEKIVGLNYNCFKDGKQGVTVKTKSEVNESLEDLGGFFVTITNNEGSESYRVYKNGSGFDGEVLGETTFYYPKGGETITYLFNSAEKRDFVKISPILTNGEVCEESDSIEIVNCEEGLDFYG